MEKVCVPEVYPLTERNRVPKIKAFASDSALPVVLAAL